MNGRRLTFQLTPLIDLLLIVMFALYLDMQTRAEQQTRQDVQVRDELNVQLAETERQILELRAQLEAMSGRVELATQRASEADRFRSQRDMIGEMVAEMFRLPEGTVEKALQEATKGPGPSASDLTQMRQRWKSLARGQAPQVVEHLLTFGELKKRVDLWEVYLTDTGVLRATVGERRLERRAESAEDVATALFDFYKSLPESKGMVLVLVTYGDAKFKSLKATLDGLPLALERIRQDAGGRARFDYAVLGFRPSLTATRL